MKFRNTVLCASAFASSVILSHNALAQGRERQTYSLGEQSLGDALRAIARANRRQLVADSAVLEGRRSAPLSGDYTLEQAVQTLLRGTELHAQFSDDTIFIRSRDKTGQRQSSGSDDDNGIVVTGSRVRGASSISPVVRVTADEMVQAGQTSLSDAIRTIPQNFNGGQNPGIGFGVPEARGSSTGGSTGLNLRGIGGDATLTLLNGHRMAYSGARQSVDLSAIPFMAIDRVEIMTDGASAIYGSDAVAGVANIVLRDRYEGLATSGRWSASTDGGNERQQYGALAGHIWATGNVMIAMDWQRATPVLSRQRDYAATRAPGLTLLPSYRNTSFLLSGQQALTDDLSVSIDGLYSERATAMHYALTSSGNYLASGGLQEHDGTAFSVAPSLKYDVSSSWQIELSAMYSRDKSRYLTATYSNGSRVSPTVGCYCNDAWSIDLQATGSLAELPAGPLGVAMGGGFRDNSMHAFRRLGPPQNIDVSQSNYYAFGELVIPVISPAQSSRWVHKAELHVAGRYERYPSIGEVFTPKLAGLFAPVDGIEFKASWGKSFRAPTLYMRYNTATATYAAARSYGAGSGSADYVLLLSGGNIDLQPERATTWTGSVVLHPSWIRGARIEISAFDIDYRDRIAAPISLTSQSLSNPAYADFVERSPSASAIAAALDGNVLSNYTGQPFDPSRITAIIYNTNRNVSRQKIRGIDLQASYSTSLGEAVNLQFLASGTYLDSTQRVSADQAEETLSGYLFNPPHVQARTGATLSQGSSTLSAFVNYIGPVKDSRLSPASRIAGMTTLDLSGTLRPGGASPLTRGITIGLSAQNLLNEKPSLRSNTAVYEQPYDPTNYSATGRVVSFFLRKEW